MCAGLNEAREKRSRPLSSEEQPALLIESQLNHSHLQSSTSLLLPHLTSPSLSTIYQNNGRPKPGDGASTTNAKHTKGSTRKTSCRAPHLVLLAILSQARLASASCGIDLPQNYTAYFQAALDQLASDIANEIAPSLKAVGFPPLGELSRSV